jgi:cyclophilin family peptidyl-prolyl cis-trans isomerase
VKRLFGVVAFALAVVWALVGCAGAKPEGISFSISPSETIVVAGGRVAFRTTVTGAGDSSATWAVEGGPANGTITSDGVYTAPAVTGRYRVIATSNADPSRTAIATVQVVAAVGITVSGPAGASAPTTGVGSPIQLTANVTGTTNTAATWAVEGTGNVGTVDANGLYTPPGRTGEFTVTATARADANRTASVRITVLGDVRMTIRGKGDLLIRMRRDLAPATVDNFTRLVSEGFYDGIRFHRFGPDEEPPIEVVQAGDPRSRTLPIDDPVLGSYDAGFTIPFEGGGPPHVRSVISMASTAAGAGGSTQFFFCREPIPFLDTRYASFGSLISGEAVMMSLRRGDTIERATVVPPAP